MGPDEAVHASSVLCMQEGASHIKGQCRMRTPQTHRPYLGEICRLKHPQYIWKDFKKVSKHTHIS